MSDYEQAALDAWSRRIGSCNANRSDLDTEQSHFLAGWDAARALLAAPPAAELAPQGGYWIEEFGDRKIRWVFGMDLAAPTPSTPAPAQPKENGSTITTPQSSEKE